MEVQSKGQKVCIRNTISSTNNNTLENPTNISNARLLTPSQMHAIVSHLCETRICLEGDRERKRGVQMVAFTPHQQTNEKKKSSHMKNDEDDGDDDDDEKGAQHQKQ